MRSTSLILVMTVSLAAVAVSSHPAIAFDKSQIVRANPVTRIGPPALVSPGNFGKAVLSAGDVNGDGFGDLLAYDVFAGPVYLADCEHAGHGVWCPEYYAYLYYGGPNGVSAEPNWFRGHHPVAPTDMFLGGATAGDANGDGYSDLALITDGGAIVVYPGSAEGPDESTATRVPGWSWPRYAPTTRADLTGDIDGDGYNDLVTLSGGHLVGTETRESALDVYFGSSAGLPDEPRLELRDEAPGGFAYQSLVVGDFNGDSYSDVAVASAGDPTAVPVRPGQLLVYLGSADGLVATPAIAREFPGADRHFGARMAMLHDLNSDGFDDLAIGGGTVPARLGRGFDWFEVYHGSRGVLEESSAFQYVWQTTNPHIDLDPGRSWWVGEAPRGVGDLNGDGFADLVIHEVFDRATPDPIMGSLDSHLRVFLGSSAGISLPASAVVESGTSYLTEPALGQFDLDGDGRLELVTSYEGRMGDPSIPLNGVTVFQALESTRPVNQSPSVAIVFVDQPLTFRWARGSAEQVTLEFCSDPAFPTARTIKLPVPGVNEAYAPSALEWLKLMRSTNEQRGLFWRPVGSLNGERIAPSGQRLRLELSPPLPPTLMAATTAVGEDPPTIAWQPNHNSSFRIVLSNNAELKQGKRIAVTSGFSVSGTAYQIPRSVWKSALRSLSPDGRPLYVAVYGRDLQGRRSPPAKQQLRVEK